MNDDANSKIHPTRINANIILVRLLAEIIQTLGLGGLERSSSLNLRSDISRLSKALD
jgi:hypothetical protein